MISASADDSVTVFCVLLAWLSGVPSSEHNHPLVDLLVVLSPAQSESV